MSYSKTRELTVGAAGTALSVSHLTSHQNIDLEIQDISTAFQNILSHTKRQGGSATDWNTAGVATQTVVSPILQCGTVSMDSGEVNGGSGLLYATKTITFPTAYTNKPIVIATMTNIGATFANSVLVGTITNTGCLITCEATGGQSGYVAGAVVSWIAIGT